MSNIENLILKLENARAHLDAAVAALSSGEDDATTLDAASLSVDICRNTCADILGDISKREELSGVALIEEVNNARAAREAEATAAGKTVN
ncbi:hypothetical protein ATN81_11655 [Agrobacterium pusense]|uniref:hypothetical protein n=1 Tax=Agrobacterium pusense TaxID=648995 RepID=UPI0009287C0D|nr:hypothetical protein [Agrobacterium pusense]OJH54907.1 hypothetical protein ATN81_11655 [Agrobacterium pusense]OJH59259.1 hypothetical protein BA725_13250 [Agrobacterium pusense]